MGPNYEHHTLVRARTRVLVKHILSSEDGRWKVASTGRRRSSSDGVCEGGRISSEVHQRQVYDLVGKGDDTDAWCRCLVVAIKLELTDDCMHECRQIVELSSSAS